VLNQGDLKIGYMVFQDFIQTANDELDEVFNSFLAANVDEVIIDLRYNGGGFVDVAEHMAGWLIGKDFGGETFLYYQHNNKLTALDKVYSVPVKSDGLSLDRIFFIGTSNTASASELLITGVKPFVGSILAGSTTHGKPVGMYNISISDYMTFPVCFKYSNKNHEGDFYNGLAPDIPADDDLTRDFGDPEEASLKAILDYIQSGQVPLKSATAGHRTQLISPRGPLGDFLKAF
jgi:C-terminal processing protease CtpA/Prc